MLYGPRMLDGTFGGGYLKGRYPEHSFLEGPRSTTKSWRQRDEIVNSKFKRCRRKWIQDGKCDVKLLHSGRACGGRQDASFTRKVLVPTSFKRYISKHCVWAYRIQFKSRYTLLISYTGPVEQSNEELFSLLINQACVSVPSLLRNALEILVGYRLQVVYDILKQETTLKFLLQKGLLIIAMHGNGLYLYFYGSYLAFGVDRKSGHIIITASYSR